VELAETIYEARGRKPIVALGDSTAASAALWIATAADRFLLRGPQARTGSVGVIALHLDRSARDAAMGLRITEVASSDKKTLLSEHQPITDAGLAEMRRRVDFVQGLFVDALARQRGVKREIAAEAWGTGEIFFGQQALELGLADGFTTPDALLDELARQVPPMKKEPVKVSAFHRELQAGLELLRTPRREFFDPRPSPDQEARETVEAAQGAGVVASERFSIAEFAEDATAALEILGARSGKVLNIADAMELARRRREHNAGGPPDAA
jgi:ClpP class serine protease